MKWIEFPANSKERQGPIPRINDKTKIAKVSHCKLGAQPEWSFLVMLWFV